MIAMDQIDKKAAAVLEGYLVRKDLVRTFSRQFPVPTYVVEFLLGRYCASTEQDEIDEGIEIVQRQLSSRTIKAGEEELSSLLVWMPEPTPTLQRCPVCV